MLRIVLPIAIPGLVCAVLFAFTLSWNEFIYALTFTSSRMRSASRTISRTRSSARTRCAANAIGLKVSR